MPLIPPMMLNKTYRKLIGAVLIVGSMMMSACSPPSDTKIEDKKNIVVTSYPEYNWLCQIIGKDSDKFDIKLLMDGGVDLHSYEPNIQDIAAICEADIFIYNGGNSYKWVDRVLTQKGKENRQTINLMKSLGDKVQMVEGDACTHCCHDHDHHHEHTHDTMHEDEHIWLSLRNASQLCEVIEEAISQTDPSQAARYEANKQTYIAQLQALDTRYAQTIREASRDTLIIADRFPFIYLFSDYGLKHQSAFQACSAETEASFETVTHLTEVVRELKPHVILTLKGGMKKLAQTLTQNSGQADCKILELEDLHTPSERSYLEIMESNLQVIKAALAP